MIQGVIFDLDGTLSDTIKYWYEIIPDFIREHGYEIDIEGMTTNLHAMSMHDSAVLVREMYKLEESPEEILTAWQLAAARVYTELAPLKEGAYEFVHSLQAAGIPLVLATNNEQTLAQALLERTGIRDCFKALFCGANLGLGKTEPTLIELARKELGSAPAQTWMFEDSLGPIRTAKSVGLHTAAMLDPYHDAVETAEIRNEAEIVFTSYAEAADWLAQALA